MTTSTTVSKVADGRVLALDEAHDPSICGNKAATLGALRRAGHHVPDGVVVPVIAINRQTGALEGVPELLVRGFVTADDSALLSEGAAMLTQVIDGCGVEERTDPGLMQERVRTEVRRYLRKRTGRRPLVMPVVMEI